jgi:hypothetical protein
MICTPPPGRGGRRSVAGVRALGNRACESVIPPSGLARATASLTRSERAPGRRLPSDSEYTDDPRAFEGRPGRFKAFKLWPLWPYFAARSIMMVLLPQPASDSEAAAVMADHHCGGKLKYYSSQSWHPARARATSAGPGPSHSQSLRPVTRIPGRRASGHRRRTVKVRVQQDASDPRRLGSGLSEHTASH